MVRRKPLQAFLNSALAYSWEAKAVHNDFCASSSENDSFLTGGRQHPVKRNPPHAVKFYKSGWLCRASLEVPNTNVLFAVSAEEARAFSGIPVDPDDG